MKKEAERTSQERISQILKELKSHNITKQDLLLNLIHEDTLSQVFDDQTIDTLEKVTKRLKEIKELKFTNMSPTGYSIPITILSDRKLSALEHITTYLKEHHQLNYKEIATLLNRDQRTIWTTYKRALQKKER